MNSVIQKLIPLADAHQAGDEYIAGRANWDGKGACSIGCTCYDAITLGILPEGSYYDHAALAEATGTDPRLWHLADAIFEGLPEEERTAWTPLLLRAVSKCDDTHRTVWRFLSWLLGPDSPSAQGNAHPAVADAVAGVRQLCERSAAGEKVPGTEWSAKSAAAGAAESAAEPKAWSAKSESAKSAARAARAARSAARSAAAAALSAAESKAWTAARTAAWTAVRSAAWSKIANQLILCLQGTKR